MGPTLLDHPRDKTNTYPNPVFPRRPPPWKQTTYTAAFTLPLVPNLISGQWPFLPAGGLPTLQKQVSLRGACFFAASYNEGSVL